MTSFPLKIVTPDGIFFDGPAEKLLVRAASGDLCILAGHIGGVFPLGMGRAVVESGGIRRTAACIGGMLTVLDGRVTLLPATFEWSDQIDAERAGRSLRRAEEILHSAEAAAPERRRAEARKNRAKVRKTVAADRKT